MDILQQDIMYLQGVGPHRKKLLSDELGITTFGDLLEYFPYKYVDRSKFYTVRELTGDMPFVQVVGRILSFEKFEMSARKTRVVAHFSDGTGIMDLVWFNYGKSMMTKYTIGKEYIVFGKPSVFNNRIQIGHPEIEEVNEELRMKNEEFATAIPSSDGAAAANSTLYTLHSTLSMRPYYNTTEKMKKMGLTSRGMERLTQTLLKKLTEPLPETLPPFILQPHYFMGRDEALHTIHYPQDAKQLERARVRLKFEELFFVQLNILRYASYQRHKYHGYVFPHIGDAFNGFYKNNLPFQLTGAQKRVMHEIRADLCSGRQMNRLLQGDVGSGKTLVALMSMLIAIDNGCQACIMAPTEILAEQHMQTIKAFLHDLPVRVELLTGIVKGKRRSEILEGLLDGSVHILVGTHAIIEDTVQFHRLGLVVIDEQHRFGVAQRAKLWGKSSPSLVPHILVMTATPIPRTLAMTLYGDLDVSIIDELPPGRKPIRTTHVFDSRMTSLYDGMRKQILQGRQIYVVFPLIEESEKIDLKDLEQGFEALKEAFPEFQLSKVHGRMKPSEKEAEMARFVRGETQMLVATTVIEVGVNVPNASVMVILDAQRFGLSQLHQLRGRVGRGADQSYCILVTPYKLSEETRKRIDIMCETNDGFRIAEADLKLRGPGDLEGTQQSGMAFDLKIANIARDGQLVQMARDEAQRIIDADPMLEQQQHQMLLLRLKQLHKTAVDWSKIS
ncbi:MAG: ATP-dependent DNA helicase RecG [Prevotella sp.]|nr:ATP-dependent DNA helicase RecG [Prevotella sp.]